MVSHQPTLVFASNALMQRPRSRSLLPVGEDRKARRRASYTPNSPCHSSIPYLLNLGSLLSSVLLDEGVVEDLSYDDRVEDCRYQKLG